MTVIELYGHEDCCLCATALKVLERLRDELGFALVEIDIGADERLHRAYFERVPVIAVDGEELFDHRVDEPVLRAHLAAAGSSGARRGTNRVRRGDDLESRR